MTDIVTWATPHSGAEILKANVRIDLEQAQDMRMNSRALGERLEKTRDAR